MILLLTNSFDLEDGFLTASNLEQVKGYLASTYPSKYSEVFPLLENCSLESELDTVRGQPGGSGVPVPTCSQGLRARITGSSPATVPGCCLGFLVTKKHFSIVFSLIPFPFPFLILNFNKTVLLF